MTDRPTDQVHYTLDAYRYQSHSPRSVNHGMTDKMNYEAASLLKKGQCKKQNLKKDYSNIRFQMHVCISLFNNF